MSCAIRRLRALCSNCLVLTITVVVVLAGAGVASSEPSPEPFKIMQGSFHVSVSTDQAGAHADLTVAFNFAHNAAEKTFNDLRDTFVNLPPGFIGNNTAVPTCTVAQLLSPTIVPKGLAFGTGAGCPAASQVGTISLKLNQYGEAILSKFPLYNMEVTTPGVAAQLGFHALVLTQLLPVTVRPGDSGLTVASLNSEDVGEVHEISVTTWGVPAAKSHLAERGLECFQFGPISKGECGGGDEEVNITPKPFLTNPTSCGPTTATMSVDSWEHSGALGLDGNPDLADPNWSTASTAAPTIEGCAGIHFEPAVSVQPTTNSAESPSGLVVDLTVPQTWDKPESLSTSNLEDTALTLPIGFTINPSAGSGLGTCSPAQFAAETADTQPGEACPQESKIGTVKVQTPVLAEELTGAVYVATPYDNRPEFGTPEHPRGSLLALYVIVKDPARGIVVKLAGKIEPNPETGQLVTRFDGNPQVPFSTFTLELSQRATSPLVSPPACGSYSAQATLTPWSAPETPLLISSPPFTIEHGIGGGACPFGGVPPFNPELNAGTLNNNASVYSPLFIDITRHDGEQEITRFSSRFPPGLTANLTGVPFCPEEDIEAAKHVSGAQEEVEPSCPVASEIGHTLVGAGVGTVLAYTPGKVYMAGPYHGAPFSIVAITSAKVGPFDLGTVVVREALDIDPITAAVTVDATASDPIPHIIDGIVIHVRDIRVYVDRPGFMINPTSCNRMSLAATVDGAGADPANPAGQEPVTVDNSFQMANCQNLQFKPTFKVSTSGRPSRLDGESLHVKLSYPNAPQGTQTNIKLVKVELPKRLPSRLPTLQKACPEATFVANPALCPAASVIGHATATTPILPVPLTGPAYFVSYGGAKFPELIIVLQGYGVTLDLHGETFISKQGVTSSTFKTVPDDPIGSFELTLPQGQYSALAAIGNPCKGTLTMPTEFLAQNGDAIHQQTRVAVTGCPKAKKTTHKKKHTARAKQRARKAERHGRGAAPRSGRR